MSECERSERNYKIVPNVATLYLDIESTDVTFIFEQNEETKTVSAHKCLLAASSPVLRQMFYGELKEGSEIRIVDVSIDGFTAFLQYFYLDVVTYNNTVISEVMKLADKYDVAGCMELCTRYLTNCLTTSTVCWIYELALLFDLGHLIGACEEKICSETQKVLESPAFLNCSRQVLGHILLMEELSCDEIRVFNGAMQWAMDACKRAGIEENSADNLKQQLGNCFDLIRFPAMSAEEFYSCISDKENLFTSNEIMDILSHLTLHRPLQVATRFEQTARRGIPAWSRDDSVQICDRRTLPNLCRAAPLRQDFVIFSVNERILLGEVAISSFKTEHDDLEGVQRSGELIVRKLGNEKRQSSTEVEAAAADDSNENEEQVENSAAEDETEVLLLQGICISSVSSMKVQLSKPLIIQPFQLYEIETKFDLDDGEQLTLRTECREEIMLDGGVRFQFKRKPDLTYDNVTDGLLSRLYFKRW